jgi:hypothetical protein
MFEDLDVAEKNTEVAAPLTDDENKPSSGLYRWAHFPAGLAFGILFILFSGNPWRWQIAIGGGYTVYVFFFAFGSVLRDADDFFGDTRVPLCAAKLLIPHIFILTLIISGVSLWFHISPLLPSWVTHEGRKESLWDLFGWLILAGAGIWQGSWMAKKIKSRFTEPED